MSTDLNSSSGEEMSKQIEKSSKKPEAPYEYYIITFDKDPNDENSDASKIVLGILEKYKAKVVVNANITTLIFADDKNRSWKTIFQNEAEKLRITLFNLGRDFKNGFIYNYIKIEEEKLYKLAHDSSFTLSDSD